MWHRNLTFVYGAYLGIIQYSKLKKFDPQLNYSCFKGFNCLEYCFPNRINIIIT